MVRLDSGRSDPTGSFETNRLWHVAGTIESVVFLVQPLRLYLQQPLAVDMGRAAAPSTINAEMERAATSRQHRCRRSQSYSASGLRPGPVGHRRRRIGGEPGLACSSSSIRSALLPCAPGYGSSATSGSR